MCYFLSGMHACLLFEIFGSRSASLVLQVMRTCHLFLQYIYTTLPNLVLSSVFLRVLVPVQRALQPCRTTQCSLLRPPLHIRPSPVLAAKGDWAAAPSELWTGQLGSYPFSL